jgi:aspartyl protease family protein
MRSVVTFASAAVVAGLIIPHFADRMKDQTASVAAPAQASAPAPAAVTPAPSSSNGYSVVVSRDNFGRFRADGRINGRELQFTVDTGASIVALTADDAAQLGIHPAATEYTMLISTANGTVRAAPAMLDMVEVGDIVVHDVAAVVMPDGALSDNLLGLSFLSRLRHFEYSDGKMVLEQ